MSNRSQVFRGAALADKRVSRGTSLSAPSQYGRASARRSGAQAPRSPASASPDPAPIRRARWHGQSGKAFTVTIHALDAAVYPACGVALAVRRDAEGLTLIDAEIFTATASTFASFRSWTRTRGATEIHILAMDPAECRGRDAIVRDLLGNRASTKR